MRPQRTDVIHAVLERAKEAKESGIKPVSWIQDVFGLSRQQATRYLAELCARGMLRRHGNGRGAFYTYSSNRRTLHHGSIRLEGRLSLPRIDSPILRELILNATTHSGGATVRYEIAEEDDRTLIIVADDGYGIFQRIMEEFRCHSRIEAAGELVKGARVAGAGKHPGLSALLWTVDFATIEANGLRLQLAGRSHDWAIAHVKEQRAGTTCTCELERPQRHSRHNAAPSQGKVLLPVWTYCPSGRLADRRDAKRMLRSVAARSEILLDFRRAETVAMSFLEYVLRDFKAINSGCSILPVNLNSNIRAMINLIGDGRDRRRRR